jgi:hypothetical protein
LLLAHVYVLLHSCNHPTIVIVIIIITTTITNHDDYHHVNPNPSFDNNTPK